MICGDTVSVVRVDGRTFVKANLEEEKVNNLAFVKKLQTHKKNQFSIKQTMCG